MERTRGLSLNTIVRTSQIWTLLHFLWNKHFFLSFLFEYPCSSFCLPSFCYLRYEFVGDLSYSQNNGGQNMLLCFHIYCYIYLEVLTLIENLIKLLTIPSHGPTIFMLSCPVSLQYDSIQIRHCIFYRLLFHELNMNA